MGVKPDSNFMCGITRMDAEQLRAQQLSTDLMLACQHGNADIVKTLCEMGADVNAVDSNGDTALIYATSSARSKCVIALCVQPGVTLHENIIEQYKEFIKKHNIPSSYVAAHLRATDKPLSFEFNISGINKPTSNSIKHGGIDSFIEKYAPMQTYIATDNKRILEELKKKHPSVIHSDVVYKSKRSNNNTRKHGLHRNGADDPQVFINAILELIILAKAKILMPSVGGYTEMAKHLWKHKDVVERMLRS